MTGSQTLTQLTRIIDSWVADNNPQALDDDLADIQADSEQREEAIDDLIKYIEGNREFI